MIHLCIAIRMFLLYVNLITYLINVEEDKNKIFVGIDSS